MIVHDPNVCARCGICMLMCSLYHEGGQGLTLSRAQIVRDPITSDVSFNVCQQCLSPSCYFACPLRDEALCIDEETGARYINEDECIGCEMCIEACPFNPSRIKLNVEKKIAFKCDLCRDREGGPICVEYCPMEALKFLPRDER